MAGDSHVGAWRGNPARLVCQRAREQEWAKLFHRSGWTQEEWRKNVDSVPY
jgi:hypothetical protein